MSLEKKLEGVDFVVDYCGCEGCKDLPLESKSVKVVACSPNAKICMNILYYADGVISFKNDDKADYFMQTFREAGLVTLTEQELPKFLDLRNTGDSIINEACSIYKGQIQDLN